MCCSSACLPPLKIRPILWIVFRESVPYPASRRPAFPVSHYAREFLFLGMHAMKVEFRDSMAWDSGDRRQEPPTLRVYTQSRYICRMRPRFRNGGTSWPSDSAGDRQQAGLK